MNLYAIIRNLPKGNKIRKANFVMLMNSHPNIHFYDTVQLFFNRKDAEAKRKNLFRRYAYTYKIIKFKENR